MKSRSSKNEPEIIKTQRASSFSSNKSDSLTGIMAGVPSCKKLENVKNYSSKNMELLDIGSGGVRARGLFNTSNQITPDVYEVFRPTLRQIEPNIKEPSWRPSKKMPSMSSSFKSNPITEGDPRSVARPKSKPPAQGISKETEIFNQKRMLLPHERTATFGDKKLPPKTQETVSQENLIYHQMRYCLPHERTALPKNSFIKSNKPQDNIKCLF